MVERFGPSRKSMLRDVLTQSIGKGISDFTNSYYANKALEGVIGNKENEKKPYSERIGALQQALNPFGETGAQILQQRLGVEQLRQQEHVQKQEHESGAQLFTQMFPGETAPKGITADQVINLAKARNTANKPNKFSPVPPEVQQLEYDFLRDKDLQDLPDEQWYAAGVQRGIPPGEMDRLSGIRQERKSGEVQAQKHQFDIHKESSKFDEDLNKEASIAKSKLRGIENQEELIDKIGPWDRFVAATAGDSPVGKLMKSTTVQEYESYELPALEGLKDTFGVRLSDADLKVALRKLATADKTPEAKRAILAWQKVDAQMKIAKQKIGDQIKKENKGLRPIDYDQQIRSRLDAKFGDQIAQTTAAVAQLPDPGMVSVISPSGAKVNIPREELDAALKGGGKLAP